MNPNKLSDIADDGGPMAPILHDKNYVTQGITLREFFAASAPPVPDWFEPFMAEDVGPPPQFSGEDKSESDQLILRKWLSDVNTKIPKHLLEEVTSVYAWRLKNQRALASAEMEQFFAWRWFYADMMLEKRLEKSRGPFTPNRELISE